MPAIRDKGISRCNLGKCSTLKDEYNACGHKRDPLANVHAIRTEVAKSVSSGQYGLQTLDGRYMYVPLFQSQDILGISNNKRLLDIMVELHLTSVHGDGIKNLDDEGSEYSFVPLRAPMLLRLLIIQVCDENLSRKSFLSADQIFENIDDPEGELQDGITILGESKEFIECQQCDLEDHVLRMCFEFSKDNKGNEVCIKFRESGENVVFNVGTFAFVLQVSYVPIAMEVRKKIYGESDPERYGFGKDFDLTRGDVGKSIIINSFVIETSFKDLVGRGSMNDIKLMVDRLLREREEGEVTSGSVPTSVPVSSDTVSAS